MMEFCRAISYFLFLVICAVFVIEEGSALKCYSCNTKLNSNCMEDKTLTDDLIVTCPNATSCRKISQTVTGDYRIIRQCGFAAAPIKCTLRAGTARTKVKYCHCQKDLCNASPSSFQPYYVIVTVMTSSIIYLTRRQFV
ncbi:UPAR/Ly6 domain-containing protein crok-like [Tubulanus polymorphus]|uniref:UPAR/Ly6 domain-containing protein crok-like n=1 Tax=Tubulanus polymorphus TaxID=672921 RepID=UPI003DA578E2